MALVINDRVKETSTTSGTGAFTLAGVASGQGNVTFNSGIGTTIRLTIVYLNKAQTRLKLDLELYHGSTTLERTTVINNSSGNTSKISFTGGTLDVFVTMPAAKTVYLDASGTPVGAASAWFCISNGRCVIKE